MARLTDTWVRRSCGVAMVAFSLFVTGCGDANVKEKTGPVQGKRLDGTETALDTIRTQADLTNADSAKADKIDPTKDTAAPAKLSPEEEKKKRDEWRDKKVGKPDPNDAVAQANIELRPSLNPEKKTDDKGKVVDPAAKPVDPTALAKPLIDPTAPIPFVDPNNPDFVPADRNLWKKFDIANLAKVEGYLVVPFADLSGFPYSGMTGAPEPTELKDGEKATEPKKPEFSIPDAIKALDGKQVMISGYMMPIDFEDGGTNEFVLTRQIPSCFYCVPPQLNDWVEVKMKDGKRVPYVPDGLIEMYGIIEVGEMKEDGFIVNMYRATGIKVHEAKQN